jgi:ribosome-binding protein aMBF1 (putative translation factor)
MGMADTPNYLDVLPLHPPPKRFESITSYLARIANENGIQFLADLSKLFDVNVSTDRPDLPPISMGKIAMRTGCLDSQILGATFFFLGRKFGRSLRPRALTDFLHGSVGKCLRYCPACIARDPYYSLVWRFHAIPGCSIHCCQFLDRCGSCGSTIPLFVLLSEVGRCPSCRADLGSFEMKSLSEQDMQVAVLRTADIEYLLSPFQSEEQDIIARQVGFQFAILRREKGLSTQQVADQLALPLHDIYSIEQGGAYQRTYFVEYLKYVEYLGGSLRDMFKQCLVVGASSLEDKPAERLLKELPKDPASQLYEDILFEHVQESIQILTALEEPITPTAIGRFMRVSSKRLKQSSVFSAHWEQRLSHSHNETARRRLLRGSELVEDVQRAADILRTFGLSPTRELIGLMIGVSSTTLLYYEQVRIWFEQHPSYEPRNKRRGILRQREHLIEQLLIHEQKDRKDENLIVEQVAKAIATLRQLNQYPSDYTISQHIGLPIYQLKSYPQVRSILDKLSREERWY